MSHPLHEGWTVASLSPRFSCPGSPHTTSGHTGLLERYCLAVSCIHTLIFHTALPDSCQIQLGRLQLIPSDPPKKAQLVPTFSSQAFTQVRERALLNPASITASRCPGSLVLVSSSEPDPSASVPQSCPSCSPARSFVPRLQLFKIFAYIWPQEELDMNGDCQSALCRTLS